HLRADRGVTLLRAEPDDRAQKRIHRVTSRHGIFGKFIAEILQRKCEPLGQSRSIFDRLRQIAKELAHFVITLQMPLAVLGEQFSSGIQMGVCTDAGENIQNLAPIRLCILNTVRSEERQSIMRATIGKLAIDALPSTNYMHLT